MRRKEFAVLSLSVAALLMAGAGSAQADDDVKYQNNNQILSCLSLEILDIPIASSANNNIDCSENRYEESYERMTHVARQLH